MQTTQIFSFDQRDTYLYVLFDCEYRLLELFFYYSVCRVVTVAMFYGTRKLVTYFL